MTIHGLHYRPAPYEPTGPLQRLLPIVVLEARGLFRTPWGVLLFAGCALPTLFRTVFLLIWLGVLAVGGQMRGAARHAPDQLREFVPTNVEFYVEQIVAPEQGMFVFLLLTAFTTARAIAKDRATNGLELLWTRGISPFGYFAAKWFGSFLLLASLTIGGPLLLWTIGVLFAEDWTFFHDTVGFAPWAFLGLAAFTAALTVLGILVSALAGSANVAMIVWCVLLGGSSILGQVLSELFDRRLAEKVGVWDAAACLARAIAGIPQRGDPAGAALLLAGVGGVLAFAVTRRLRVTEAVG